MSEELTVVKEEAPENNIISMVEKTMPDAAEDKIITQETAAKSESAASQNVTAGAESAVKAKPDTEAKPNAEAKSHTENKKTATKDSADDPNVFDFDEDEPPKKHSFFRSRSQNDDFLRDKLILSRIKDEDLLEYLTLEQQRLEFLQQAKERKEKRILTAFQLTISLAAIVAVTYLLKDNPTILISILYIVGIIAAFYIWKNPRDKDKDKDKNKK